MTHVDTNEYVAFTKSVEASFDQIRTEQAELRSLVKDLDVKQSKAFDSLLERSAHLSGAFDGNTVAQCLLDINTKIAALGAEEKRAIDVPEREYSGGILGRFLRQAEVNWLLWFVGFFTLLGYQIVKNPAVAEFFSKLVR
jgi:hypothetical protein